MFLRLVGLLSPGAWELNLTAPMQKLASGKLIVSVKDRQGNTSRIERTFTVGQTMTRAGRRTLP